MFAQTEYHACGYRYRDPIHWAILLVYMNILISRNKKGGGKISLINPVWLNRAHLHLTSRGWLNLIDANVVRLTVWETLFLFSSRTQIFFSKGNFLLK